MPRRSASARSGRCGESGLTLMAVALFHGSMLRSRAAATSAPAKFGIRPCGGNGKRATPSALSLSQTHCRAALLSAKPRAMAESGAARPGDSQGRNLLHEKPWGDPCSPTLTRGSRSPCSMVRPCRRPSVAAEKSGRRLAWAVLESVDAIKLDAVVYPSWNNPPHCHCPQFAARQVGRQATKP